MKHRAARGLAGLALALVLAPLQTRAQPAAPVPDVPAGPGTIRGRVIHGGDARPAADIDVVLYALSPDGGAGLRRGVTDAAGRFRFERIANASDTVYLVGVRIAEVPYGARAVFAEGQRELELELEVAEPDAETGHARAGERVVRIDRGCEGLFVTETHALVNPTGRALFVPEPARGGRQPILREELPASAGELVTPLGTPPLGLERDGAQLRFWGPLYPGQQQLEFGYALPTAADRVSLAWSFSTGAPRVVFLTDSAAPPPRGADLTPAGERELGGHLYRATAAAPVAPGTRLELELEVPAAAPAAVGLSEARVWLELDDAALTVDEQVIVEVPGEHGLEALGGAPLLCLPLPAGAENLRFSEASLALGLAPDASGSLALRGPLPPGESSLSLRFRLPLGDAAPVFTQHFPVDLPLLSVFVADTGVLAESPRLHRRRPIRSGDRGFSHLESFGVGAGEEITLHFSRLPAVRGLPRTATAGFALLVAAATLAFLTGPLRRRELDAPGESRASALASERERVYAAIHDLEDDLDTGKLTADDHDRLRAELRARAVHLLAQERAPVTNAARSEPPQASEERAPAGKEAPSCGSCGTALPPAARFCPGCGVAQRERPV